MNNHWTRRRPLWLKILALTVFVLLLPIIGFLMLNQFGRDLIDAEEKAVLAEASALSSAIEIAAVYPDTSNRIRLDIARAQELLVAHAFSKNQNSRVRLYDQEGQLLLDSDRLIQGLLGRVSTQDGLEVPNKTFGKSFVPTLLDYKTYRERGFGSARPYDEVIEALQSEASSAGVYSDAGAGRFRILGASAISSVQAVMGAVLIDHNETGIEAALAALNQRIIVIFLIAFGITILVSLLLATIIAGPVTRLAAAARRLASREMLPAQMPTFPDRRDEIGDLATALQHMARALMERADAAEAFAAEVAHELKNPLTSLRSATETLSYVDDDTTRDKLLAVLIEDTDRLDRLISDISASSRLDAELAREETGSADLVKVVKEFIDGQKMVDPDGIGSVRLIIDTSLGSAPVRISATRIIQVVENLLSNAFSFCPDPSEIKLRLEASLPDGVRLIVEDRGPGVPLAKIETIFKRFFTDRPSDFGKHSGLGLSIVQRLSESAGGRCYAVNRTDGKGVKFIVDLPLL